MLFQDWKRHLFINIISCGCSKAFQNICLNKIRPKGHKGPLGQPFKIFSHSKLVISQNKYKFVKLIFQYKKLSYCVYYNHKITTYQVIIMSKDTESPVVVSIIEEFSSESLLYLRGVNDEE